MRLAETIKQATPQPLFLLAALPTLSSPGTLAQIAGTNPNQPPNRPDKTNPPLTATIGDKTNPLSGTLPRFWSEVLFSDHFFIGEDSSFNRPLSTVHRFKVRSPVPVFKAPTTAFVRSAACNLCLFNVGPACETGRMLTADR